jgi:hypothetical protein
MSPTPEEMPMGQGQMTEDDAIAALAAEVQQLGSTTMSAVAPKPGSPYQTKTVVYVVEMLNKAAELFGMDPIAWMAPEDPRWPQPLPPEIYGPFAGFFGAIKAVNEDGRFDKYVLDPMAIPDDKALRHHATIMDMALQDQDLVEALKAGPKARQEAMTEEVPEEYEPTEEDAEMLLGMKS